MCVFVFLFPGRILYVGSEIKKNVPSVIQGRGNKSSGDNFHAAPNIDHSQDFVRNDIKEWLCWLRLILLHSLFCGFDISFLTWDNECAREVNAQNITKRILKLDHTHTQKQT